MFIKLVLHSATKTVINWSSVDNPYVGQQHVPLNMAGYVELCGTLHCALA